MLLEIKDIWVYYGTAAALKGVSVNVFEKSVVALVGPNGAGKSTLVRTISGLKRPVSGEIWFQGKRIDKMPSHMIVAQGIAHVPEGRRIFPEMTVLGNLRMGAYRHLKRSNLLKKDVELEGDLERVYQHFPRLKERLSQQSGSLSGGEQQMLAIGRALMAKPHLLLLDEPSMGLAPTMVREIEKIITAINKQGVSILLVEQNARMAFRLAQKAYVLEIGEVAMAGATAELTDNEEIKRVYLG